MSFILDNELLSSAKRRNTTQNSKSEIHTQTQARAPTYIHADREHTYPQTVRFFKLSPGIIGGSNTFTSLSIFFQRRNHSVYTRNMRSRLQGFCGRRSTRWQALFFLQVGFRTFTCIIFVHDNTRPLILQYHGFRINWRKGTLLSTSQTNFLSCSFLLFSCTR